MKSIVLCALLIAGVLSAEENKHAWLQHWSLGLEQYQRANYANAEAEFTTSIDNLGKAPQHLYIYNERAKALFKMGRYQEAIADFSIVLAKPIKEQLTDRITALWGRSSCYALLNDSEGFRADYEELRTCDTHFPKVELYPKMLIIRNLDVKEMTPAMRHAFCCALLHAEMCTSPSDITFYEEGFCVVKRLCHCGCKGCFTRDKQFTCPNCGKNFLRQAQEGASDHKVRCLEVARTAFIMNAHIPSFACHSACIAIAESLIQSCYWQCDQAEFYERCVTPFLN